MTGTVHPLLHGVAGQAVIGVVIGIYYLALTTVWTFIQAGIENRLTRVGRYHPSRLVLCAVDDEQATLRALDVPAGQFVELRTLVPRRFFTSTDGMRVESGWGNYRLFGDDIINTPNEPNGITIAQLREQLRLQAPRHQQRVQGHLARRIRSLGHREELGLLAGVQLLEGDLRDKASLERACAGVDVVYQAHCSMAHGSAKSIS